MHGGSSEAVEPAARIPSDLVLPGIPKYGLARATPHSYALPHSKPDPTPEHRRGPDLPKQRAKRGR
jgi:hypothetical protein